MRDAEQLQQQQQHRRRTLRAVGATLSVIAALSLGGASASLGPRDVHPVEIQVRVDRSAILRQPGGRAIPVSVWVSCDIATVGEIDSVLEMRVPGRDRRVRVVRNVAVACDPTPRRTVLIFESRDGFALGDAWIHLDVSAGFVEEFATVHIGPKLIRVR